VSQPEAPAVAGSDWWTVFHDATLNDLEKQAVAANQDIQIAVAHVDQADATRRSIRSAQLPTVTADPSVGRTREAQQRPNNGNTNGKASTYNDIQLPLVLNYEIDAWDAFAAWCSQPLPHSRQPRPIFASYASPSPPPSQPTTTTFARPMPKSNSSRPLLSISNVATNHQQPVPAGIISELAVKQAQTILDQTRARIEALHIQRSQSEHAVAVLLGRPASGFSIAESFTLSPPPVIPAGVPADLLGRRPDIAAAERTAAAASARSVSRRQPIYRNSR